MIIAVDFDGTIVRDRYPEIGKEIPFATSTLKMLMQEGHQFVLWTVRRGHTLEEAVEWCRERGYSTRTGFRDYVDELVESQDSIWDNYREYGHDI